MPGIAQNGKLACGVLGLSHHHHVEAGAVQAARAKAGQRAVCHGGDVLGALPALKGWEHLWGLEVGTGNVWDPQLNSGSGPSYREFLLWAPCFGDLV